MRRKNIIILATLSTLTISVGLISNKEHVLRTREATAVPCTHEHVEHYSGFFEAGSIEVEHWACCSCHTAWADSAKTIEIGNTTTSREKINSSTDYEPVVQYYNGADWDWGAPFEPQYSQDGILFNTKNLTNVHQLFFNFTAPFTLSSGQAYSFVLENNTNVKLTYTIVSRLWNKGISHSYTVEVGAKASITSEEIDVWNYDSSNGVAVRFMPVGASTFNGSIRVSLPNVFTDNRSQFLDRIEDANWQRFSTFIDAKYGYGFSKNLSSAPNSNIHLRERVKLDETLYTGVEFLVYNSSDRDTPNGTIWNEGGWEAGINCKTGVLKAHEWTPVYIPTRVWNFTGNDLGIYDMSTVTNGELIFAHFKFVNYAYGAESGEVLTIEKTPEWPEASKEYNDDYGFVFNVQGVLTGKSFATNNGKTITKYKGYEFYAYNYSGVDITMRATNDWNKWVEFGTLKQGVWTKCYIPAEAWNNLQADTSRVKNMHFYPSGVDNAQLLVTLFRGVPNDELEVTTQYLDMNISTDGALDESKSILLDVLNDSRISAVNSITYKGNIISNNKYVPVASFGYDVGEATLTADFILNGVNKVLDLPVVLCSKLISNKTDLDSFQAIANAIAGNATCEFDGYFALANDIEYNGNWDCIAGKNAYYSNSFEYNPSKGFRGTFDGNGHLINGLHVTVGSTNDWNGNSFIYKLAKDGVIKNVGFTNAFLTAAGGYVASIGEGTISNVYVKLNNNFSYCDGFGTFFYYDRGNDTGGVDKSYAASLPLTIENCFVDGTLVTPTEGVKENAMSFIGSKMYGRVMMNNVFCVASENYASHACRVNYTDAGYFAGTANELKSHQIIIDDINNHLSTGIFDREDIELPRDYVASGTNYFVDGNRSDYSIVLNAPYNSELLSSASLLVKKIYEFSKAKLYVSRNIYGINYENTVSINVHSCEEEKMSYAIEYSNNVATLTCHDDEVISKLVIEFLNKSIGYARYGDDIDSFSIKNTSGITLSSSIEISSAVGSYSINSNNYSSEHSYEMGTETIGDTWMNVISDYDSSKSGNYHNQFYFLPPEIYYSDHPSWFTPDMNSTGGYFKQTNGLFTSNLCFNAQGNSRELALMKEAFYDKLKRTVLENPTRNMICVGQHDNDGTNAYCSCSTCKGQSNPNLSIINFLNDMSARLKADPELEGRDIYIYTMAYRQTQYCPDPTLFTVDDHVGVWIAPIGANYSYALNDTTNNSSTSNMIYWWRYVTPNIALYMYDSNFIELYAPFNSFNALIETYKYLNEIGCKDVYFCTSVQNNGYTGFGAFRQFIQAKAGNNINLTLSDLEDQFFSDDGYYGKAGSIIRYYFDELKNVLNANMSYFANVYDGTIMKLFKNYSGSMSYWYQYVVENAYAALDTEEPNYEVHYKHIEQELLFLRYAKYITSTYHTWYSGDSTSQFISDCNRLECSYIQEGKLVSSTELYKRRV